MSADLSIRSESNSPFHLEVRAWPDGVTQLLIQVDDTTHAQLGESHGNMEGGAALALQLNPFQLRDLIKFLEPHAAPTEVGCPCPKPTVIDVTNETILAEAQRIVHGPRRASYGHPARNFGRIAALWNAYIEGKDGSKDLDATDVAMMMILLKMARILHSKDDRDGHTDIVGYAACSAIINGIDPS